MLGIGRAPDPAETPSARQRRLQRAILLIIAPLPWLATVAGVAIASPGADPLRYAPGQVGFATGVVLAAAALLAFSGREELGAILVVVTATASVWASVVLGAGTATEGGALLFLPATVILAALLLPGWPAVALALLDLALLAAWWSVNPDASVLARLGANAVVVTGFLAVLASLLRRRDVVAAERAAAAAHADAQRLALVLARAREGVLVVEREGAILMANAAAARTSGWKLEELEKGPSLLDMVAVSDRAAVRRLLEATERGTVAVTFPSRDGPAREAELDAESGRGGEVVVTVRDLAPRRAAEAAARDSARREAEAGQAREVERHRQRLLNLAFHELNTPITVLRIQAQLLIDEQDETARRNAAELLLRNSERLVATVQHLLDVARDNVARPPPARAPFDLADALRGAARDLESTAALRGIALDAATLPPLPVLADEARTVEALGGALSCAIALANRGSRLVAEGRHVQRQVFLLLHAHGLRLDEDERAELFEPFRPATPASVGNGGLYVSQRLASEMGGRVWVEPLRERGGETGTTIGVMMPAVRSGGGG